MKTDRPTRRHYDLLWPAEMDPLAVEFEMIRRGGEFDFNGKKKGKGLFYHYKAAQTLLWPDDDHHRWSDLMLESYVTNRITVVQGGKDSSKTHTMSKFGLLEYWVAPHETLVLMSSTDIRGLELRVWGDVKDLFTRGKDRFDWLAGNAVDAKHGIFTDGLGEDAEVRDMRKGLICIPCVGGNGEWVGIQKYCFPGYSLIETPQGLRRIDQIKAGDAVFCAAGASIVTATSCRSVERVLRVTTSTGEKIDCTPEHPFLTQRGWVEAQHLSHEDRLITLYETMQIMRQGIAGNTTREREILLKGMSGRIPQENLSNLRDEVFAQGLESRVLHEELWREMEVAAALGEEQDDGEIHAGIQEGVWGESQRNHHGEPGGAQTQERAHSQSHIRGEVGVSQEELVEAAGEWRKGVRSLRQRIRYVSHGGGVSADVSGGDLQSGDQIWTHSRGGLSALLPPGLRMAGYQTGGGIGWRVAYQGEADSQRQAQGGGVKRAWVVSVEILKRRDFRESADRHGNCKVYNLQVAGHPSYAVSGFVVHNCGIKQKRRRLLGDELQFMRISYIDAMANLDKGDFKGVFVGNPIGQGDPLDKLAEPINGWDSLGEITKTTVWDNKFGGKTINLVGIDSPNFDEPRTAKPRYPYLIAPEDADRVAARWGKDSHQWFSQIMGTRRAGLNAHRVLTRELCLKFGAYNPVIWAGEPTTKIYGLDAAYGGDRCVGGFVEFGKDKDGVNVLKVNPPIIVPILVKSDDIPEDQISAFIRKDCERNNIPPSHVYFDSTGRGSLGTSFGRLWSTAVNPVEFGGVPTTRPVSHDIYILDDRTKERRLKLCNEHYSKFVTELYFSVRYCVESGQLRSLPQDVADEFFMREWCLVKGDKIEVESKIDTKERMGCSPDLADWLAICVEGARRQGFRIERLAAPESIERESLWLETEMSRHKMFLKKSEITYS